MPFIPPWPTPVMALHCPWHKYVTDPLVVKAMREIEELEIHDTVMDNGQCGCHAPQPLPFPIWDTALLINALIEAGNAARPSGVAKSLDLAVVETNDHRG